MIPIQANSVGFSGRPATLYSAYDGGAMVLAIAVSADFSSERYKGSVLITNSSNAERDALFTDKDIKDAVEAYYALKTGVAADGKSTRLTFGDRAANADPGSAIERDGVDSSGFKYRIAETISCAQVAALMACWYVIKKADVAQSVFSMADSLRNMSEKLNAGGVLSF